MNRTLLGVAVLFVGCLSPTSEGTEVDAGVARGVPDAGVWFDSSMSIAVTRSWLTTFPGASGSGSECVRFERADLSADQTTYLEELRLKPFRKAWCADGYDYVELRVYENDGSSAAYRDTGCDGQAFPDAGVMLPYGVWSHFQNTGTACQ